jgi:hypothetical protein
MPILSECRDDRAVDPFIGQESHGRAVSFTECTVSWAIASAA